MEAVCFGNVVIIVKYVTAENVLLNVSHITHVKPLIGTFMFQRHVSLGNDAPLNYTKHDTSYFD